jgi:glycine oxidase
VAQHSEILIVGGGVIGLCIARSLCKAGFRDIALLEQGTLGCEASAAAAGMLAPQAEADSADVFFDFCRASLAMYPDLAAELFEETGVDIELDRTGTLYLGFDASDARHLDERRNWQLSAGLRVEELSTRELLALEKNISTRAACGLLFPDDWQVENRRLIAALRALLTVNNVSVFEHSRADELIFEDGKIAGVTSGSRRYLANTTILTTGAWTSLIKFHAGVSFTVKPIRGQMLCFRPDRPMFSHVIYSPRGYLVPRADGRLLAGATVEDVGFDKSVTKTGAESLHAVAAEIAPFIGNVRAVESWAGLRPFVTDGVPVIGALPGHENLLVATGHYRNGILLAPLTAKMIASQIAGESDSRYLEAFGAARFGRSIDAVRRHS